VVAGASFRANGVDVLGDGVDVVVEILTGVAMLKGSVTRLLKLLVVFMTVDGEAVVLSPACDTRRSNDRVTKSQKFLGGWGHRNSILPWIHGSVDGFQLMLTDTPGQAAMHVAESVDRKRKRLLRVAMQGPLHAVRSINTNPQFRYKQHMHIITIVQKPNNYSCRLTSNGYKTNS
jgi:hypothetical protein